jgi:hypothetical protein
MPEVVKKHEVTKQMTKTQPWRAVWPAAEPASSAQVERKAQTNGSNGLYGYNDKNEGIAPKK